MKLIFLAPSFYPAKYYGGPIFSTYNLAKELINHNIDVKVVSTNSNGNTRLNVKTNVFQFLEGRLPVKYYCSLDSKGTSPSMIYNLKKDINPIEIVYLVSIFSPLTPFVIWASKSLKKKLIISPRGQLGKWCLDQGSLYKKLWLKVFIEPYINYLQWHLTAKEEEQDVKFLFPKANTFIVPNGVNLKQNNSNDIEKDRSFYKKYCKTDCSKNKIIISMGRIHKKKGFDILIESLFNILQTDFDAYVFIAGEDFGERANLETLIKNKNILNKVFFIGNIEGNEKEEFFKNADVFALPSHDENFGIVYAEALAAGTPIVASKNTPWQEVETYQCGKWVDNTPGDFANAIIELFSTDQNLLAKNAKRMSEKYSWPTIASTFKDIISKI